MILDNLGLLRGDGTTGADISAAEAGYYNDLERHTTTGRKILDIRKTGYKGIPVVVITNPKKVAAVFDRAFTVTIEASAGYVEATTGWETVATFPVTSATFASAAVTMIRRVHTQKRYIRCKIALTTTGTNGTQDFLIFVTSPMMDTY